MADLIQYKCPNCSGAIEYNAQVQKMKCPYCDTEFDMEALKALDDELKDMKPDELTWERSENEWADGETDNMNVYVCQSCGGEVIGDATLGSTSCPYCGNPVVMKGKFAGDLKPDLVIPFKKTKEDAKAAYLKHLEGKRLLPKVFKEQNHIDEIKGLYIPVWIYNSDVDADMTFSMTRRRTWEDANFRYVETKYYKALRSGNLGFDNIPVGGSTKLAEELLESVEPFDSEEGVDFQTAYLAGYMADRYDVDAKTSEARANERIKKSTEEEFGETVQGYDTVSLSNESIRLLNGRYRYALYPAWILSTHWNDQNFTFIMNAQTGKMAGNLPMDKSKFALYFLLSTGIGAVITYVLLMLFAG